MREPGPPHEFEVLFPGLQTTVQDAGRRLRALGVPAAGAADPAALRVANALVGNAPGAAALEVTVLGPTLHFRAAALVALCGAPFGAQLGGRVLPQWRAVPVQAGETLRVGAAAQGMRAVLAVRGGLRVPAVLGSRATDLRAGFGGLGGRALRRGDVLAWSGMWAARPVRGAAAPAVRTPTGPHHVLRALPTAEATPQTLRALTRRTLTVSAQADRMGVRLDPPLGVALAPAPALTAGRGSLPNVPGAAQLPPDGRPILLLPDAGTHGGYPTPLVVIGADVPRLGQLRPGDRLRFQVVTPNEAVAARRDAARALRGLEAALAQWYNQT